MSLEKWFDLAFMIACCGWMFVMWNWMNKLEKGLMLAMMAVSDLMMSDRRRIMEREKGEEK